MNMNRKIFTFPQESLMLSLQCRWVRMICISLSHSNYSLKGWAKPKEGQTLPLQELPINIQVPTGLHFTSISPKPVHFNNLKNTKNTSTTRQNCRDEGPAVQPSTTKASTAHSRQLRRDAHSPSLDTSPRGLGVNRDDLKRRNLPSTWVLQWVVLLSPTSLILLSVPRVPSPHQSTRVVFFFMNLWQHLLTWKQGTHRHWVALPSGRPQCINV